MRFFSSFFYKKKAVYSQTTFVLLLILYFSILSFSYIYYTQSIDDVRELQFKESQIRVYSHIQDSVLRSIVLENNEVIVSAQTFAQDSVIRLNNSEVTVITSDNENYLKGEYSLFGVSFCNSYDIYLERSGILIYNGSCISYSN